MKIQLQQALATVLNIQIRQYPHPLTKEMLNHYVRTDDPLGISLGRVEDTTLAQAIWKAMELSNMEAPSAYAIFPIESHREEHYMKIERELLRQEKSDDFGGKKMWELMSLSGDPREVVTVIMEQLRNCAKGVVMPDTYCMEMFRTACLLIASLQWCDDWRVRLEIRNSALKAKQPKPPEPVPDPPEDQGFQQKQIEQQKENLFHDPEVVKGPCEEALDREARMNEADRTETPL